MRRLASISDAYPVPLRIVQQDMAWRSFAAAMPRSLSKLGEDAACC